MDKIVKLKVLMASTSYPKGSSDWKAVFIRHLVFGLSRRSDLTLRLWSPFGEIPKSVSYACTEREAAWLSSLMEMGGIAHLLRTRKAKALRGSLRLLWYLAQAYRRNSDVDVIHANWLQTSIPLIFYPRPAVITVLGSDFGLLRLPGVKYLLRIVLRRSNCILAPNGEWMIPGLKKHFGDLAEIRFIPFGIDKDWFSLRRLLEPGSEKWVVVSRLTAAKIGSLFDWGQPLFKDTHRELHLFGPMQEHMDLPDWAQYHGPTHSELLQQNWVPRATGLITLSSHDEGQPQIVLEAMAAGLPVVASDLQAHRSAITHRDTGWLCSDRKSFAEGIEWLADPDTNRAVGRCAREYIRENYGTWDDCVNRYVSAYRALLD